MNMPAALAATYRLQLSHEFTFADATRIVPYLHRLGISHVYTSPILRARAGSAHGYDIVDHNSLNPELGDADSFAALVEALVQHDMGLILDIVPNHMGVGGDDNAWWLDVLENGEASACAGYFDIDWHPVNPALHNRVLLPFLGDHYGTVLEQGELELTLDPAQGAFSVHYYEHRFPVDPRSYPNILSLCNHRLGQQTGTPHECQAGVASLIRDCQSLPRRTELSATRRRLRQDGGAACKRRLAGLCRRYPEIRAGLDEAVRQFNGTPGRRESFDPLHRLLEAQAYRLAYWQVASDEINYRRFFDINDLAGLRMENRAVFDATHRLIRQLIARGQVAGLRIDHPDGLSDPFAYCCDLRQLAVSACADSGRQADAPFPLLVEKVMASFERLPADWPVAGTTGYKVAQLLNGLFVDPAAEHALGRLYNRFTGRQWDFDALLYDCKKLIIHSSLASELSVLANLASSVAQRDRHTRDYTYLGLRDALAEITACFPVYRTYITASRSGEDDRRYVNWAIARAKQRSTASDIQIFDFLHRLLLTEPRAGYGAATRRRMVQFALRFQQYTAPVMAKGLEDTACYVYNRLTSLNDVGFDPRTFGVSTSAFHLENRERQSSRPRTLVATSTHDSKRGEDVRARINVLSEVPHEWQRHLARWSRVNRGRKHLVDGDPAPDRNDEYLLYQTLLGTWPLERLDAAGWNTYTERIAAYMQKTIREAKRHTSWINPHGDYEEAVQHFVHAVLNRNGHNAFLADFVPFEQRLVRPGLLNSLSQTLLRLTIPGVPDIYQGNERWCLNLVDPDNRRPVDFRRHLDQLQALEHSARQQDSLAALARELLDTLEDGRIKLYVTWIVLSFRRQHPGLFSDGDYLELATHGPRAAHICAFARRHGDRDVLVAAARWFVRLADEPGHPPRGTRTWDGCWIEGPAEARAGTWRNILTGEAVQAVPHGQGLRFNAAEVFAALPLALLEPEHGPGYSS
jgi:(1->4)-alpha-D-glucan 1-alpha-D-glucosylmutase